MPEIVEHGRVQPQQRGRSRLVSHTRRSETSMVGMTQARTNPPRSISEQLEAIMARLDDLASSVPTRAALPPAEAAEYIGFGVSTMRRWRAEGIGPLYVQHGSSIVYRVKDLDDWLRQHLISRR